MTLDESKGMKVFVYPDYTVTNPYQNLLYSRFTDEEIIYGTIDKALDEAELNSNVVFHLHWPNPVTSQANNKHEFKILAKEFLDKLSQLKSAGGVFVWTIHNAIPHDSKYIQQDIEFHANLSLLADSIVVHDSAAIKEIKKSYYIDELKVTVIPHGNYIGVYPETSSSAKIIEESNEKYISFGFIGQLRPYKGIEVLLSQFRKVKCSNVNLLVAGKCGHPYSESEFFKYSLNDKRIKFSFGFLEPQALVESLNLCDFLVLPYSRILTSGSVFLAFSFRKPVILPNLDVFREFRDYEFVFMYEPDEDGSLTRLIEQLAEFSKEEIFELGDKAYAYAKTKDWKMISLELRELFRSKVAAVNELRKAFFDKRQIVVKGKQASSMSENAVLILNYRSFEHTIRLANDLDGIQDCEIFILDTSEGLTNVRELATRTSNRLNLLYSGENLGYAAGNNYLTEHAISLGCKNFLIVNPDVVIDKNTASFLLNEVRANENLVLQPLILREDGNVSFSTSNVNTDDVIRIHHNDTGIPKEKVVSGRFNTDTINGCTVAFNKKAFDAKKIPENYFLYFEETDWSLELASLGFELRCDTSVKVIHKKNSQPAGLPAPFYAYYLTKSLVLFTRKYSPEYIEMAIKEHCRSFVDPWREKIAKRDINYKDVFDYLVSTGIKHGLAGVEGKVDLFSEYVPPIEEGVEETGAIEQLTAFNARGWLASNESYNDVKRGVHFLTMGSYISYAECSINRADVASLGFSSDNVGFDISFDRELENGLEIYCLAGTSMKKLNDLTGKPKLLRKSNISSGKGQLTGRIDGIYNGVIRGWAVDHLHPGVKVEVDLYSDNTLICGVLADKKRPDLSKSGIGDGANGFEVVVPHEFLSGEEHLFAVFLADTHECLFEKRLKPAANEEVRQLTSVEDLYRWALLNEKTPYGAITSDSSVLNELELNYHYFLTSAKQTRAINKFSVIMPLFNREGVVSDAIESVLKQSYKDFELIVVDDGSVDKSAQIVREFVKRDPRVKLIEMPVNIGVSQARNAGIASSTGDFIAFLDSDNTWDENYLEIYNYFINSTPDSKVFYSGQAIYYGSINRKKITNNFVPDSIRIVPFVFPLLQSSNYIDLNTIVVSLELVQSVGGFDRRMTRLVDWDFIMRIGQNNPFKLIPCLLSNYSFGGVDNQITNKESFGVNLEILGNNLCQ